MKPKFDSPLVSVFLRRLAWEINVAKKDVSVKTAIEQYVNRTRNDIGLESFKNRKSSGGADKFIQERYADGTLRNNKGKLELIDRGWKNEWRLLFLPSHGIVRQLSFDLVVQDISNSADLFELFLINSRDPAIPTIKLYVGKSHSFVNLQKSCKDKRGVYFLGHSKNTESVIYIGKTDEFDIRLGQHITGKHPEWAVFLSLEEHSEFFTLDSLAASEGLLNYFWNEIALISTDKWGNDKKPVYPFLQQAILFMQGVSASIIWLVRENKIDLPFRKWKGKSNWYKDYIEKQNYS